MLRKLISAGLFSAIAGGAMAQEDCGRTYVLQQGDTLLSIAQDYYAERSKWSVIYYANETALGGNLVDLPEGVTLNIPCVDGETLKPTNITETVAAPEPDPEPEPEVTIAPIETPLLQDDADIKLVTGSNYAPFTDQDWPNNGMMFELVNAAFEEAPSPLPFSIVWENDWSKHLFPMLDSKQVDMGFPWYRPNCEAEPQNERCANFHFSKSVFDILVLIYVNAEAPFDFDKDEDLFGKTICREKGYFTHDLDGPDRRWVTDGKITLVRADTTDDCFRMVAAGDVDAVSVNEFLGTGKLKELSLQEKVVALERPVGTQGLHVVISKRHWRGTTNLYRFNAGLEQLKKTDRYDAIVSRHMELFRQRNR